MTLKKKADELEDELEAVMQLGVDKWLTPEQQKEPSRATRAGWAREKALQAIEEQERWVRALALLSREYMDALGELQPPHHPRAERAREQLDRCVKQCAPDFHPPWPAEDSEERKLRTWLELVTKVAADFLHRSNTLMQTHDSYGLFQAGGRLKKVLDQVPITGINTSALEKGLKHG